MIVGVCGLMRHGKDEVARALTKDESLGFVRMAVADPLKDDMLTLDPYIDGDMRLSDIVNAAGWEAAKSMYPEVRRILQVYGTEVVRHGFGSTMWPERLLRRSEQLRDAGWHIVVPDVRFIDEVTVPPLDLLIFVHRPGGPPAGDHASEQSINDCIVAASLAEIPVVAITNDSTIEQLHKAVLTAVSPYL